MLEPARRLVESLASEQAALARRPVRDEIVRDWHYVPRSRPGLPLEGMSEAQRTLLWRLVEAGLSGEGGRKAHDVPRLERILGAIEGRQAFRDPLNYAIVLFGEPGDHGLWGWRFEGHHLSLTFMLEGGRRVAPTPIFFGANRQRVPHGHEHAGLRILPEEEDRAFALVQGLAEPLLVRARLADRSPGDIVTGPGREASLRQLEGVDFASLQGDDRGRAIALLETYIGNLREDLAEIERKRIRDAGIERIHFAWAGALAPGRQHYYRLQGPTFVIEYENSQNDANHCHSVWHNPLAEFGRDLLKLHHEASHAPGEPPA